MSFEMTKSLGCKGRTILSVGIFLVLVACASSPTQEYAPVKTEPLGVESRSAEGNSPYKTIATPPKGYETESKAGHLTPSGSTPKNQNSAYKKVPKEAP